MALELEPVGIIFTEIRFMNHRVERRAKLQRNRKIFRQKGMSKFWTWNLNYDQGQIRLKWVEMLLLGADLWKEWILREQLRTQLRQFKWKNLLQM